MKKNVIIFSEKADDSLKNLVIAHINNLIKFPRFNVQITNEISAAPTLLITLSKDDYKSAVEKVSNSYGGTTFHFMNIAKEEKEIDIQKK